MNTNTSNRQWPRGISPFRGTFQVRIWRRGIKFHVGTFHTLQEAENALSAARARVGESHHNACHGRVTAEYRAWRAMITRCYWPQYRQYYLYGGRGITVCDEWRASFEAFLAYVGARPSPKHTLDRIDGDGNYQPGNVRWATAAIQQSNKRTNVLLSHDGKTLTITQWAVALGINYGTIRSRLKAGIPIAIALSARNLPRGAGGGNWKFMKRGGA